MDPNENPPEAVDLNKRVDAHDPPSRLPTSFDQERAAQDCFEGIRHRGGREPKKDRREDS